MAFFFQSYIEKGEKAKNLFSLLQQHDKNCTIRFLSDHASPQLVASHAQEILSGAREIIWGVQQKVSGEKVFLNILLSL